MPFTEIVEIYGTIPVDWKVFAIERSPYRKVLSLANMKLSFKEYKRDGKPMKSDSNALSNQIDVMIKKGTIGKVKNVDLYKDKAGNIRVDILRYENLEEDVDNLMLSLGILTYPKLEHFKKGLSSNNLDMLDIFTKEQIQTINELFYEEFSCFGYSMIG